MDRLTKFGKLAGKGGKRRTEARKGSTRAKGEGRQTSKEERRKGEGRKKGGITRGQRQG
jgi:hypothetical protein